MMTKFKPFLWGKYSSMLFFFILLSIIIYKVCHVPITHDENASSLFYPKFSVWQIMMYPDNWPNNHILNTLLIKLEEYIFGIEPWSIRIHSVIAFIVFYIIVYLIAGRFFTKGHILFFLPFCVFFCNPFLLDFFGLARGYGLSNTLMACSVYTLLRFSTSYKASWYYLTIVFAMLAAYANFTLLIFWVAVHILLLVMEIIYALRTEQPLKRVILQVFITGGGAICFLALSYIPLYKMQSTNQFVYWSKAGFFDDTIVNQSTQFYYGAPENAIFSPGALARQVIAIFIIAGIYSAITIYRNMRQAASNPLVIVFLLLACFFMVNMTQTILLGTPYLTTRVGLCYYVLFAFVFIFLMREVSVRLNWFMNTFVPLAVVLLLLHLYKIENVNLVREWWYDAHTYDVQNYLNDYRKEHSLKNIELNSTWIFNPSFKFYCDTHKTPWLQLTNYHKLVDTSSQTLFYYATYDDVAQLKKYRIVKDFPDVGNALLIKR